MTQAVSVFSEQWGVWFSLGHLHLVPPCPSHFPRCQHTIQCKHISLKPILSTETHSPSRALCVWQESAQQPVPPASSTSFFAPSQGDTGKAEAFFLPSRTSESGVEVWVHGFPLHGSSQVLMPRNNMSLLPQLAEKSLCTNSFTWAHNSRDHRSNSH